MTLEHFVLTAEVQTILLGIAAILCFVKYRSRSLIVRLLGFNFLMGFMANVSSYLMIRLGTFRGFSNIPGVCYSIISITLLSYIYWIILFGRKKIWFSVTIGLFTLFTVLNFYYVQKTSPNTNSLVLSAGILICYSLWYFYTLIRDLPSLHVHQLPMFWFNSALLLLNAGTFFLFSFTSYLINVLKSDLITYWSFHNMMSIFAHLLVLVGLYYDFRQVKITKAPSIPAGS